MAIDLSKNARQKIVQSHSIFENDYALFVSRLGEDPKTYFEGKDWRGVDFRETDVRNISLSKAKLRCAIVDGFQIQLLKKCPSVDTSGLVVKDPIVNWNAGSQIGESIIGNRRLFATNYDDELWVDIPEDSGAPRSLITWSAANMQIKEAFEEGERPAEEIIDHFIKFTAGTDDVMSVLRVLRHIDYSPSSRQLNLLLTRCTNFSDACEFLSLYADYQLRPNIDAYTRLVSKTRVYHEAISVVHIMNKNNVRRNRLFFNRLIVRTSNLNAAREVLSQMNTEGIRPNTSTYNTLISKCSAFEEGQLILEEMRDVGLRTNVKTYNRLLAKLHLFAEAMSIVEQMVNQGINPDEETIRLLVRRAKSGTQALKIIQLAKEAWLEVSMAAYETAVNIAVGEPLVDLVKLANEDGLDVVNMFGQPFDSSQTIRGGGLKVIEKNPLGM